MKSSSICSSDKAQFDIPVWLLVGLYDILEMRFWRVQNGMVAIKYTL